MRIKNDIHIHTTLSACAKEDAILTEYVRRAKKDGLEVLGFSNHLWDSTVSGASNWYKPQTVEHVMQLKTEMPQCMEMDGIRLMLGCETEFTYEGKICLAEENMSLFDYILVPHSHTHMSKVMPQSYASDHKLHAKFLMDSFMKLVNNSLSRYITAIAHPFVPGTNYDIYNTVQALIPDSYLYEAFRSAKEKGIAIELNGSCLTYMPDERIPYCEYIRIYSIAKECGCRFTYGSDSHSVNDNRKLLVVENFCQLCRINEHDFLSINEIKEKSKLLPL